MQSDSTEVEPSQPNSDSSDGTPTRGDTPPDAVAVAPSDDPVSQDDAGASQAQPSAERPSQRIQIGSQRASDKPAEAKAKPVTPATPQAAAPAKKEPKHYPPPNIRDRLSPDLEAEYEAALSGMSLDALLEQDTAADAGELEPETRVTGRVAKIHRDDVFVDLGGARQGVVPLRQFEDVPPPDERAEVDLLVVRFNADEGLYDLSRPTAAVDVGNWEDVAEGQIVEVTVTGSNKGGLECQIAGLRGFIPLGQLSIYRVEQPEEYVGQRLACVVTEANRERRNLVLSHRAVMERERAEQRETLMKELAPGQIREGIVRSLKDFGAFVDLGGVDGLVHISQLSWDRVGHPSEVVEVGQKIKVRVEKFDPDTGKVGLSYREAGDNPWQHVESKYSVGSRLTGKVSRVMDFGAFVKLEPGVEGLIHISELAHGRVFRTSDVLSEGQEVEVKVLSVDMEKQRIGLSLKALMPPPEKEAKQPADEDLPPPPGAPKPPKKKRAQLKGGIGGPSGGEKYGLNW